MSQKDKEKWDKKYTEMSDLLDPRPPSEMVTKFYKGALGKSALDLACGSGRHTIYLSENGFYIDAVDISPVALQKLEERTESSKVSIIQADLDTFVPMPDTYDLIVNTNYLDRDLIERAKDALKTGGIFIIETYAEDEENEKRDSNPDFLLKEEELLSIFDKGFTVLEYKEFWNETYEKYRMKKQAIAVRKDG